MTQPPTPLRREFKRCSCGQQWATRSDFLADPGIKPIGYQAFLDDLVLGLFLFNHAACATTLAVKAGEFETLYDGPIYQPRLTGSDQCEGHCLSTDDLEPRPNHCECAYVREILQMAKVWPKRTGA